MNMGFGGGPIPHRKGKAQQLDGLTPDRAILRIVNDPGKGKTFPLNRLTMLLGRSTPPELIVDIDLASGEQGSNPSMISRRHAEFLWANGDLQVRDLGSTNGTYYQGKPLPGSNPGSTDRPISDPVVLRPGDHLLFGDIEVEVTNG